jgi:transcription elongation factor GreA
MSEITYLTKEGYDKLRAELQELKGKGRNEMAQAIQKAREMGDLSENAEYDAAKDAQGLLEMRISKLETIVANSRIIDDTDIDPSKAFILSSVKMKNSKSGQEVKYTLVAEQEADIKQGKISVKSPVGKAILGKSVGELVEIQAPAGIISFEVLEITREAL